MSELFHRRNVSNIRDNGDEGRTQFFDLPRMFPYIFNKLADKSTNRRSLSFKGANVLDGKPNLTVINVSGQVRKPVFLQQRKKASNRVRLAAYIHQRTDA